MKITCEIIKDLLPLYHDGVCSSDSKIIIEEHLASCDSCKTELEEMDDVLQIGNNTIQNIDEAAAVKKLSKRWKKGMMKSLVKGIVSATIIIAIIMLILYIFLDVQFAITP